jgi:hypothetical protein
MAELVEFLAENFEKKHGSYIYMHKTSYQKHTRNRTRLAKNLTW